MISDPKTTPDSRAGRVLFAALVAVRRLVRAVPAVPDERPAVVAGGVLGGRAAHRSSPAGSALRWPLGRRRQLKAASSESSAVAAFGSRNVIRYANRARARWSHTYETNAVRCHVVVDRLRGRRRRSSASAASTSPKADTKLFNKASQVVLVRDGDRTVMTMANDFEGDAEGVRGRHSGADVPRARADPRRREGARRSPRRVLGAAARRVLRSGSVRASRCRTRAMAGGSRCRPAT